jgi:hypothetical protein
MSGRVFIPALAITAGVAALLLFVTLYRFVRLSEYHLHDAPHLAQGSTHVTKKIIGDEEHLTAEAKAQRAKGVSLQDLIKGCGQDFDRVFEGRWRRQIRFQFQIAYFFLVLCFILTLASGGQLLAMAMAPATEYSFWTRAKTGTEGLPAIHKFSSLSDCRAAQKAFEPARLVAQGCGCEDVKPTKQELINRYLLGDEEAGQFARLLGYELPPKSGPATPPAGTGPSPTTGTSATNPAETKGDYRFWFVSNGTLTDEMFPSKEACLRTQSAWSAERNGPIVFPCAEVTEELLKRATEESNNKKEFADQWKQRIEEALRIKGKIK